MIQPPAGPPQARRGPPEGEFRAPGVRVLFRRIWPYVRPEIRWAGTALVLMVFFTGLNIPTVHLTGRIIDSLSGEGEGPVRDWDGVVRALGPIFLVLAAILILRHVLSFVRDQVILRMNQRIEFGFRRELFRHLLTLSPDFFERRMTGQILAQMLRDAGAVSMVVMGVVLTPVADVLTLLAYLGFCFYLSPTLLGIVALLLPFYAAVLVFTNRRLQESSKDVRDAFESMTAELQERLSGMTEIQLFHAEKREAERFGSFLGSFRMAAVRQGLWRGTASVLNLFLHSAGPLIVLYAGVHAVRSGSLSVGELMAFYLALGMVYGPLGHLIEVNAIYQTSLPSLVKVLDFLTLRGRVEEAPDAKPLEVSEARIRFDDVSFRYDGDRPLFDGLSFEIPPGTSVGICGPTGCGKSTLLKMVARLVDPDRGVVAIDGQDLRQSRIMSIRERIAVVTQFPFLFKGSVKDNIRYGRPDATDEEVAEAARSASIHDEILAMPSLYETDVGERGVMLSGGQRQRIAIARAFLRRAPILLLDEPTSALDANAEAIVLAAMDRLIEGHTALVVAHRLSTIKNPDRILVLAGGRVVEDGKHDDLLARGGLYRKLWDQQTLGTASGRPTP